MPEMSKEELYCIARHLKAFHECAINEETSNWGKPCKNCNLLKVGFCKLPEPCIIESANNKLREITGVGICWMGYKKSAAVMQTNSR
jgi:hypothetical protein